MNKPLNTADCDLALEERKVAVDSAGEEFHRACKKPRTGFWRKLGPGFITGGSDDDPSDIATYSLAGAAFGFGLLWTMLLCLPLMAAIQEISARIGRIIGKGIAGNIRQHYSAWLLYPMVFLLVAANTINIGADIGAVGDAIRLLVGGPALICAAVFALIRVILQVFASYPACCSALKWLTLSLFSYVGTVLVIHVPWKAAMKGTFLPSIQFKGSYWATMIALLGTTISPYLFFRQASQKTEEIRNVPQDERLKDKPQQAREQFGRIRFDTYIGMAFSNLVAYFIILAAAATLNTHGVTDVQTSAQAAEALRPHCRKVRIFSILFGNHWDGSFGGACNGWFSGIRRRRSDAMAHRARSKTRGSQGILWHLTIASLLGLAINFPTVQHLTRLSPIKALFWSAVINGVVAGPIMIVMMLMCHNKNVMGQFVNVSRILRIMGWLATGAMLFAAVGLFVTWND